MQTNMNWLQVIVFLFSALFPRTDGTPSVANTYDRGGRLGTVTQNGTVATKTYNGANELLGESYAGGTLGGLAVAYGYDGYLRRNSANVTGYAQTQNSYTYDNANRLATVGDGTYSATYAMWRTVRWCSR